MPSRGATIRWCRPGWSSSEPSGTFQAFSKLARTAGLEERFLSVAPDLLASVTPEKLRDACLSALTPKPTPRIDLEHVAPIRMSVAEAMARIAEEGSGVVVVLSEPVSPEALLQQVSDKPSTAPAKAIEWRRNGAGAHSVASAPAVSTFDSTARRRCGRGGTSSRSTAARPAAGSTSTRGWWR